ncbi:MAG: GntR family transcriptional regulator [Coriobacteriales bacterium]|jgi:GntR family transcriptional regulator|nr:GntR family transcriptional regulator [Coriobacteriales bacterium]
MRRIGKPLYATISADLKEKIIAGELNPGDMLPSENELAQRYDTSRMTVRMGLQSLEQEELVYSWQGKGYFVASPSHDNFAIHFSDEERGFEVVYREINASYPSEEVGAALEVSPNQIVIEVCRIIKRRGAPVALDMKYIPYDKGLPTLEEEMNYAVFPEIAAMKTAPFAFHTKMEIAAELPNESVARLLQCPTDVPLLTVYRWLIDSNNRRVGYGVKYMLPQYGKLMARSGYGL